MKVFYPGSFDPIHKGHLSIIKRCLYLFDEIVIGIGINKDKKSFISTKERKKLINKTMSLAFPDTALSKIKVISYNELTAEVAVELRCNFIVRGIRDSIDLKDELISADINELISGIETIFLPRTPSHAYISSSVIRELYKIGREGIMQDIVSKPVYDYLKKKPI